MQDTTPAPLALQNRTTIRQSSHRVALWITVLGAFLVLAITAVVLYVVAAKSGASIGWDEIAAEIEKTIREDWLGVLLAVLGVFASALQILYIAASRRLERLVLNELGISYVSSLPKALQFLHPSWSLQWSQIQRAEFKTNAYARRPEFVTLVLHAGLRKRSIRPYMWVDPATYQPPSWKKQLRFVPPNTVEIADAVMSSPVMRFMKTRPHLELAPPDLNQKKPFALEKNPVALGFVGLFFVSIVYAFIDAMIVNPETYVAPPFYTTYVMGGLALGLAAFWLMRASKVPMTEAIAVAVLSGGAFAAALYPGLLRINQFTDTEGLHTYKYKMVEPAYFIPIERDGLPELEFPHRHREFWSQYEAGSIQEFELRKGALEFYQINMQPIYDRINDFYEKK